jgi:hypothetical protein
MQYVYLLRSKSHPEEQYVGCTTDLKKRLLDHNRGDSLCQEKDKAVAFEKYLKSGSGRAFAKRHFS